MADQQFKPKWNPLKFKKLRLYGVQWANKKSPMLAVDVYDNNPRFKIYLNNGSYDKAITLALDPVIMQMALDLLIDISNTDGPQRYHMDVMSYRDHRGNKYDKPSAVGRLHFGRDNEGVVFMAVVAKGEEAAKFRFGQQYYAPISDDSGEKLPAGPASSRHARAWAGLIRAMLENNIVVNSVEPKDQPQQQRGSSSSGTADFDDDIAF